MTTIPNTGADVEADPPVTSRAILAEPLEDEACRACVAILEDHERRITAIEQIVGRAEGGDAPAVVGAKRE
jgi:hypothetical protein